MRPKHIELLDSYVQGMIAIANEKLADDGYEKQGSPPMNYWLEDFRTIRYGIPRAMGALAYIHEKFVADPNGIIIVEDFRRRDMIRDKFTRDGKFIDFMKELNDESERGLPSSVMNRIITTTELRAHMCACANEPDPFQIEAHKNYWRNHMKAKTIYIEDGKRFFSKQRMGKFYQYLADYVLDKDGLIVIGQ